MEVQSLQVTAGNSRFCQAFITYADYKYNN